MTRKETFHLDVGDGAVEGVLRMPESASHRRFPTVLICRGLHTFEDDTAELLTDAAETFRDSGLATADFEARSVRMILDDFHAYTASDNLEDTLAVFDWLTRHDAVDRNAIGVLGYNLGGITAACLAGRTDRIRCLALLSPGGADRAEDSEGRVDLPEGYLESVQKLTPMEGLLQHERPTLIVHGAADRDVDPVASFAYRTSLERAGRPVEHLQVALADHTFSWSEARLACVEQLDRFFSGMKR